MSDELVRQPVHFAVTDGFTLMSQLLYPERICRVYWGSHGCDRWRGHDGPHLCISCFDENDQDGWVGGPPYYGADTRFYGEDASALTPALTPTTAGVDQ